MAVQSLEVSLVKPLEMAIRLFFGNDEITLGLWTVIAEIPGFDDEFFKYFSGAFLAPVKSALIASVRSDPDRLAPFRLISDKSSPAR